jgi:hypothetical protein
MPSPLHHALIQLARAISLSGLERSDINPDATNKIQIRAAPQCTYVLISNPIYRFKSNKVWLQYAAEIQIS